MFVRLIREEIELVRLRARIVRNRLSTYARDRFRDGYERGYGAGRRDQRRGLPDALQQYRSDPHPQVEKFGVEVDEGIARLLIALWKLGLDTQVSCQGHVDKFVPHRGYGFEYASQIVFGNVDHAVKFLKKTAELLGYDNYTEGGVVLTTMAPLDEPTPRAEVRFSPTLLEKITTAWEAFELTVPVGDN